MPHKRYILSKEVMIDVIPKDVYLIYSDEECIGFASATVFCTPSTRIKEAIEKYLKENVIETLGDFEPDAYDFSVVKITGMGTKAHVEMCNIEVNVEHTLTVKIT